MKLNIWKKYLLSILSVILVTIIILSTSVLVQFRATIMDVTLSSSKISERNLLNQLGKRAELMVLFLSEELANALYQYDLESLYQTCATALRQKNVSYIYVYDPEGRILQDGTRDNKHLDQILQDETSKNAVIARDTIIQESDEVIDVATPIMLENEIIGGVRIGLSTQNIHFEILRMAASLKKVSDEGLQQALISVILVAAALSLGGVLVGVYLARRLSNPIAYLSRTTEKIGKGEYDIEIPINSSDEIGELANSIKTMAVDLRETTVSKIYVDNIIKNIVDLLIVTDSNKVIQTVNTATCRILGFSEKDLLGCKIDKIISVGKIIGNKPINSPIEEGLVTNHETTMITKIGEEIPVLLSCSTIVNSKSEIDGIVCVAHDLRQFREAEEEKKRLESQLQKAQKMEALGTLAGGVAHDLNNILSGIISYPELLLLEISEDDPIRRRLLTIKESGEKAATIVQDLLTLTRRGVAITEIVNLNTIIEEYLESPEFSKLLSFNSHIRIDKNLDERLLNIQGSPVHLAKTVMNLVSNAAEAISHKGIIRLSTYNQYIDSPVKGYDDIAEGDYVTFEISDTGIGINHYDIDRIFEPFYTKKIMGRSGTGLGMAVVWGTVKDHHGYIDVMSEEGKGSTFKLFLPATREALTMQRATISIDQLYGNGELVLVIDDVKDQREIASEILTKLGYNAVTASSGEEAITYLKDNPVDILVLDMIMDPGINGLETYKQITALYPGQKAIIASGYSENQLVKEAQRIGAGQYVKKPYTMDLIGLAIKNELSAEVSHQ